MTTRETIRVEPPAPASGEPPRGAPVPRRFTAAVVSRAVGIRLVPLLLFLAFWEFGSRYLDAIDIAGVGATLVALVELLGDPLLWSALAESNGALVIGYVAAVVVGLPLGLKMGRSRVVDGLAQGYLSILLIAPVAMIIPIIIMALGFGVIPRSIIIFIFVLPMIVVNARTGVRTVPADIIEMGRCFGAGERQLWRHVILPSAAPAVFTGLRIGVGRAVTGMVIAEWLLAAVGIGALLLQFRGAFRADSLFAVIIVVLVESLVLVQLLRAAERRVVGWSMP
jgi:ABC-type nitrate/sulfonate/bicarbonate transport system permease component